MGRGVDYTVRLLKSMIENKSEYFDKKGRLNSEGFKILNKAIESLAAERPETARILRKARKKADLENVIKAFEVLTSPENT
ncbi:MAG: hypothetical protein P3X22_000455 [Thermoprotei archaeon]|nr:hypothetical protein [Thermoprotei archaeon]